MPLTHFDDRKMTCNRAPSGPRHSSAYVLYYIKYNAGADIRGENQVLIRQCDSVDTRIFFCNASTHSFGLKDGEKGLGRQKVLC